MNFHRRKIKTLPGKWLQWKSLMITGHFWQTPLVTNGRISAFNNIALGTYRWKRGCQYLEHLRQYEVMENQVLKKKRVRWFTDKTYKVLLDLRRIMTMPKKLLTHFMNNQSHQKYGISTRQTVLLFGQMRTLGNFPNVISMQQSFPVQIEAIPTSKLNFPFLI